MIELTDRDRLRNIVRTYRAHKADKRMVLPTALMLLLEGAGLALDEDNTSRYADAMQRRTLARRDETTTGGELLKEGV